MTTIKIAIIALMSSAFLLSACGRRGPLEAPTHVEKKEKQDKPFILNPLIKS